MADYTSEQLKGKHVIDSDGRDIGKVDDIAIDPDQWRVRGLLVDLDREVADDLRVGGGRFSHRHLEVSPERIHAFGDNVILNLNTDELAAILRRDTA